METETSRRPTTASPGSDPLQPQPSPWPRWRAGGGNGGARRWYGQRGRPAGSSWSRPCRGGSGTALGGASTRRRRGRTRRGHPAGTPPFVSPGSGRCCSGTCGVSPPRILARVDEGALRPVVEVRSQARPHLEREQPELVRGVHTVLDVQHRRVDRIVLL